MKRETLKFYGLGLVVIVVGFVAAYQFVEPAPSRELRMAAGPEGGAYYAFAQRYHNILEASGIDLIVEETDGSVENFRLLETGEVDVAFLQGGVGNPQAENLQALGSVFLEPLWIFTKGPSQLKRLRELEGHTIAVGGDGSGTRALLRILLQGTGLSDLVTLSPLVSDDAVIALRDDEIDAVGTVASVDSRTVRTLATDPEIAIAGLERADGFDQAYPYLDTITLSEGVLDFELNHPRQPIELVAAHASLVGQANLHPAHVAILLIAAREVHGNGDLFSEPGDFPSATGSAFPLNDEARRFYNSGPPFLIRYLPFWLATFIDRMAIMLLPFITLLLPLARIVPMALDWRFRNRVFRWYAEIADVEASAGNESEVANALERLDAIDRDVSAMTVPAGYRHLVFNLRTHIDLVRSRLEGTPSTLADSP